MAEGRIMGKDTKYCTQYLHKEFYKIAKKAFSYQ